MILELENDVSEAFLNMFVFTGQIASNRMKTTAHLMNSLCSEYMCRIHCSKSLR